MTQCPPKRKPAQVGAGGSRVSVKAAAYKAPSGSASVTISSLNSLTPSIKLCDWGV